VTSIAEAESAVRGFAATREEEYLEPLDAAATRANLALADARGLTADNPAQQRRLDQIERKVRRLIEIFHQRVAALRSDRSETISIEGVAAFPGHAATVEDLLRTADTALYQAKHGGRDRVVVAGR
jgi:CHASE3 domain sensor protein